MCYFALMGRNFALDILQNNDGYPELIGEPELVDDERGVDAAFHEDAQNQLPTAINWKTRNLMDDSVFQGGCNICGWVAGIQALSSRAAIATENFQPWSIQNIILCNRDKFCSGTHQNRVPFLIAKNMNQVIPRHLSPLIKSDCIQYNNCTCLNARTSSAHAELRSTQWFFVGPVLRANTPEQAELALQTGPLTTCYLRTWKSGNGNHCRPGCAHANSIIGYDKERWYLQESMGGKFRYPLGYGSPDGIKLRNGTWYAFRNSTCAQAILQKAYYPLVFFDYDKANAYFVSEKVQEDQLGFIDKSSSDVNSRDYDNIGMAKRRCSLIGSKCKGVVRLSTGSVELISKIGLAVSNSLQMDISRKKQMVVHLRHASGKYVGIRLRNGLPQLMVVPSKANAAPFFISDARLLSYDYPNYLISNKGNLAAHRINKTEIFQVWELRDTNLRNIATGNSLDVDPDGRLIGRGFDKEAETQRFHLSLSGEWKIYSEHFNSYLRKKNDVSFSFKKDTGYLSYAFLRWQARQVLTQKGKPFNSRWELGDGYFKMEDTVNHVEPTDAVLKTLLGNNYFGLYGKKIKVYTTPNIYTRWTFEYDDL